MKATKKKPKSLESQLLAIANEWLRISKALERDANYLWKRVREKPFITSERNILKDSDKTNQEEQEP